MQTPLYIRIRRKDGKRQYAPVAKCGNGKIKPLYAHIDGKDEHHPKGVYHLRLTIDGKRQWKNVGNDPAAAIAAALRYEAAELTESVNASPAHQSGPASQPQQPGQPTSPQHDLNAAIATYIAEVKAGKAHRTYTVYKHTVETFRKVCTAQTVEGIRREDVLAFIAALKEIENTKRTISNKVMRLRTFCNRFGRKLPLLKTDRPHYKYTEKNVQAYSHAGQQDVRGLEALAEAAGKNWLRGIVLYSSAEVIPFSPNLHAVPTTRLWSE